MEFPPFPGFRPAAFDFLRDLKANNDRDWFKPRKSTYDEEIVWPMRCLLAEASREASHRNFQLAADPQKSIFRIYRDTRFSKNKDPYKTSCGAVLSRDGTTKGLGGFYIHVQPETCFFAAGFWRPSGDRLRLWRAYLAEYPDDFLEMNEELEARDLHIESEEKLKRIPRGYEEHADTPIEPFLKYKSFTVTRSLPDSVFYSSELLTEVIAMMEDVYPLLEFGWKVEQK